LLVRGTCLSSGDNKVCGSLLPKVTAVLLARKTAVGL
jgi:hypothetical protein